MSRLNKLLTLAATTMLVFSVQAHSVQAGDIEIIHPVARPTVPGIGNGVALFGLKNDGSQEDRLIGAQTPVAQRVEIHDMTFKDDVMRMFEVKGIDLPPGKAMRLGDGNHLHMMLMGLKEPLKVGEKFQMTLEFEKAGAVPVEVWVEQPGKKGQPAADHDHHGHH